MGAGSAPDLVDQNWYTLRANAVDLRVRGLVAIKEPFCRTSSMYFALSKKKKVCQQVDGVQKCAMVTRERSPGQRGNRLNSGTVQHESRTVPENPHRRSGNRVKGVEYGEREGETLIRMQKKVHMVEAGATRADSFPQRVLQNLCFLLLTST